MPEISEWIRSIVGLAKELRELPSDVLWIFMFFVVLAILIYEKTEANRKDASDREIRALKADVENKTADALEKLGDASVINSNAYRILAERINTAIELLTRR